LCRNLRNAAPHGTCADDSDGFECWFHVVIIYNATAASFVKQTRYLAMPEWLRIHSLCENM
jgi:hypothetical protein